MKKISLTSAFFPFFLLLTLTFCQSCKNENTETVETTEEEEDISEVHRFADKTYRNNCSSCHDRKVTSFINRTWKNGNSWNEVYNSIVNLHKDKNLVDFSQVLPDSAIEKLTDYILVSIEKTTIESFEIDPDHSGTIKTPFFHFKLDTISTGLEIPWGLAFLPNNDLLIADRNGKLYRQVPEGTKVEISGVPKVKYERQGGLLDVVVHPNFESNQTIYLSYSKPKGEKESTTAILMARLVNNELIDQKIIMEAMPYQPTELHYGSRMVFDDKGYLFITMGDRFRRDETPQNLASHSGKIHRINPDGSIPADNPFINTPNAIPSIWSYGHRNPQGLIFDKESGILWESEHAPRGGDEINIIEKGKNYGWPIISYGINYSGTRFTDLTSKEGMEQPVHYYLPSTGTCGLTIVRGDKYPTWKGNLLAGSLRYKYLSRLVMKDNKVVNEERLLENIGRVRAVITGNDGYIYFSVETPGYVFRIMPVSID